MIKAPFNFVPLPDQVVFPEWAPIISHDVPFSDGISGTIGIRLTAETPIFVRNGHSRSEKDSKGENYDTFCRVGDRFFLPGTTVKGAVRSVLEILSFGKMRLDRNARFAQREWDNPALYPMKQEQQNVRCGWLRIKEDGSAEITDCGKPLRIGHDRIDEYFECSVFQDQFSRAPGRNLNNEREIEGEMIDPKTAYYKYRLIERMGSLEELKDLTFSQDEDRITRYNKSRMMVDFDGDVTGTIVLTGQPDLWRNPRPTTLTRDAGKFYEFIFRTPGRDARRHTLTEEEFSQYKFIYADSIDWRYANERLLPSTGIPVFFRVDNRGSIKDWGLAFLYKLPDENTPYDTLPPNHRKENHDMAECIFGYADKESSLKGRVQFSPFMSDNASLDANSYRLVLNGPKASYYPIYIDQRKRGNRGVMNSGYQTYNDGMISGWKRYLRCGSTWVRNSGSDTVDTYIRPIKAGAVFEGTVRFHNLKPEELGALLSAITFHGNEDSCRHQIGMAKPYGYGKLRVEMTDVSMQSVGAIGQEQLSDKKGYMWIFEKYMSDHIGFDWIKAPTVKELLTLAEFDVPNEEDFKYMVLDMNGRNDFNDAKGGRGQQGTKYYLQRYSDIIGRTAFLQSLWDSSKDSYQLLEEQRKAYSRSRAAAQEEAAQAVEEERKAAVMAAKVSAGLSFLEEVYEVGPNAGKYKIDEFKKLRSRLKDYLDKVVSSTVLPEGQWAELGVCLLRLAKSPSRDEKKKKLWTARNSSIWQYIENVTSKDHADSLFAAANP